MLRVSSLQPLSSALAAMAAMGYRKTSHSFYHLKYHVVWITKYRKPVLRGQIAVRLRELVRQTCAALDVYILSGHIATDHVHLLVSVPPHVSVSTLMQRIKGGIPDVLIVAKAILGQCSDLTVVGHVYRRQSVFSLSLSLSPA